MELKKINGVDAISLKGRIDSGNASEVEEAVFNTLGDGDREKLAIDVEDLEYISSAGLRIILRLKKKISEIAIINASAEVYEVLDMTGFTEMMDVQKGYRKLSVEGCEVIGKGANGIVYRIDPDTIVKVYLDSDALPDIHRERELARTAFVLGVPTAIPYDVVKVGDTYGSVFELLNADSISKLIQKDPDNLEKYVGEFVELLKIIHSTEVKPDDMPDEKQVVIGWVDFLKDYLPEDKWARLNGLVDAVPDDNHMIHGDYHTKNVMMQNGESLLIDMDTLAHGAPVFEFASIFNAFVGFSILDPQVSLDFQGLERDICHRIWAEVLRGYFDTEDEDVLKAMEDKAALVGYSRLMRRLIRRHGLESEEGRKTIDFYRLQIEELLDRVDNLEF